MILQLCGGLMEKATRLSGAFKMSPVTLKSKEPYLTNTVKALNLKGHSGTVFNHFILDDSNV